MKATKIAFGLLCSLFAASACGGTSEDIDTKTGEIIRSTSNGGRDQVVLLYGLKYDGSTTICSGSYFAPRVVLTAAHCLSGNLFQMFVYYGDNYPVEKAELTPDGQGGLNAPPLGGPSHWSKADSWQINPAYNSTLNSSDMGVVFLDRKPPFDPLPLYRNRVNSGIQMTITGWGSNSAPTPVTGAGSGVERSGRTITLGSPTAADYHADDPNPGMLDANVRQTVLKTNGAAPWSNGCFGDSGGPLIYNVSGQDYVAGVGSWTGLSCEDYNLWTRLENNLPFLDLSYKRGGQDVVKPLVTCVTPNPQGSLTAIFGYQNDNGVAVSVPYGTKNASARDTSSLRPTRFEPGLPTLHQFAFGVDFTAGQTASWTLAPDNNPSVTVNATAATPRCTADQAVDSGCVLQCRAKARSGCARAEEADNCAQFCTDLGYAVEITIPECNDARISWQNCVNAAPPGVSNWDCNYVDDIGLYGKGPQPTACSSLQEAYTNCILGL